jgi:hypothetical protein
MTTATERLLELLEKFKKDVQTRSRIEELSPSS